MEDARTLFWETGGVVRVISLDPGLSNVGLCVFDWTHHTQTLVAMKNLPLPDSSSLSWKHKTDRLGWIAHLGESIQLWLTRYVVPLIDFRINNLLVIEENDLPLTKDWAPLAVAYLNIYSNVYPKTVLPKVVHKWLITHRDMPRRTPRPAKKLHVRTLFHNWLKDAPLDTTFDVCEHSCDAWINGQYVIERLTRKL